MHLDYGLLEAGVGGGGGCEQFAVVGFCGEFIRSLGGWGDFEGLVGGRVCK